MESATILTPPSTHQVKRYSAFRTNPMFPKDQNMKKKHYIDAWGEVLPSQHGTTTAVVTSK